MLYVYMHREQQFATVFDYIVREQWDEILQHDELNREIAAGRVLACGFKAMQPRFPPTFKRVRGKSIMKHAETGSYITTAPVAEAAEPTEAVSSFYDKKRIPSYTDRILYVSLPGMSRYLKPGAFTSCEDVSSSDHKPVRGEFSLITFSPRRQLTVTYDEKLRPRPFVLKMTNMRATNLSELDLIILGGGSDPYIVVTADPEGLLMTQISTCKTSIILHNLNPVWKDTLTLYFASNDTRSLMDCAHLLITVWDYDSAKRDDLIGVCAVPFAQILEDKSALEKGVDFTLPIYNNGLAHGTVYFTLTSEAPPVKQKQFVASLSRVSQGDNTLEHYLKNLEPGAAGCGCSIV